MSKAFRLSAIALMAASFIGLGAPAMAQGKKGDSDVKITHHADWDVRCSKSGGDCEMTQLVNSPETGKPIMRVVMGYPPQIDSPAMIFILPLGTRLAPGIQLSVDGRKPSRFPFQICLQQGCRADLPINNTLLTQLKGGRKATVTIIGPKGDSIDLNISLSGFTAANSQIAS